MRKHVHFTVITMALLIVFTTAILEILLHLAARSFPEVETILFPGNIKVFLSDSDLIVKGNSRWPEHDANGFRNANIPNKAEIVSIGDSQTYGTSVNFDESWPRILEKLTSCRVYNMSVPTYGPLQYAILAEQATRFEPRVILIGIYLGNDFYDNWQMYIRRPDNYPVPESLSQPAIELERKTPLAGDVEQFFRMGSPVDKYNNSALRGFFSKHSSLWGFGRAVKNRLLTIKKHNASVLDNDFQISVAALTPRQLEYASIFEGAGWRTILTSRYREAVENDDDPRIRVGYWLTEWAVQHINNLAQQNGIRSIFILLPTKESVFASKVRDTAEHRYFKKLTTEENGHRQRLIHFMQNFNISYFDLTQSLRTSAIQPYFENADGHPNVAGHKIIAARLVEETGICK